MSRPLQFFNGIRLLISTEFSLTHSNNKNGMELLKILINQYPDMASKSWLQDLFLIGLKHAFLKYSIEDARRCFSEYLELFSSLKQ